MSTEWGVLFHLDAVRFDAYGRALILREELTSVGPDLLVNNADFATIIRKRKAVGAEEAVIVFSTYCRVGIEQIAAERA